MDGVPEGTASLARPAARPYTCIALQVYFQSVGPALGMADASWCRVWTSEELAKGERQQWEVPVRDETETGRGGDARQGKAGQGRAWRGASSLSEFLVAWKGLAEGVVVRINSSRLRSTK